MGNWCSNLFNNKPVNNKIRRESNINSESANIKEVFNEKRLCTESLRNIKNYKYSFFIFFILEQVYLGSIPESKAKKLFTQNKKIKESKHWISISFLLHLCSNTKTNEFFKELLLEYLTEAKQIDQYNFFKDKTKMKRMCDIHYDDNKFYYYLPEDSDKTVKKRNSFIFIFTNTDW